MFIKSKIGLLLLLSLGLSFQSSFAAEKILWYLPNANDDSSVDSFIRIINNENTSALVTVSGSTENGDAGQSDITFTIQPNETKSLRVIELQNGSVTKGLTGQFGDGNGPWKFTINSPLNFDLYAYIRSSKGYITKLNDTITKKGNQFHIPIFNPGSNLTKVSYLRISNNEANASQIQITGTDEDGQTKGPISASIAANSTLVITSQDLEAGNDTKGLSGGLGNGTGKWQLKVTSDDAITLVNLLSGPDGFMTNMSAEATSMADFKISSTAYENGSVIPKTHACTTKGGNNLSPQLQWINAPAATNSFAVIMDDEISPCGTGDSACSHWNVVNIPLAKTEFSQGESLSASMLENADKYYGPCPPSNHSYNITVYALDSDMPILDANDLGEYGLTRSKFSTNYSQYILAKDTLNGQYK